MKETSIEHIDRVENNRTGYDVYQDNEGNQYYVIFKKKGTILLEPIVVPAPKKSESNEGYD